MIEKRDRESAEKVVYFLLACLISIGIWFFVDNFGNNGNAFLAQMQITDIPIDYTGVDDLTDRGLMLLNDETNTVDITFEGARLLIVQLNRSQVHISADLSGVIAPGIQTVPYTLSYLDKEGRSTYPANQKFASLSTNRQSRTITVNIAELNRKEVDVRCELVGTIAEGYSARQPELSQNTVEIRGLEDAISDVSYAKVTLDLGNEAKETVTQLLTCQFFDVEDQLITNEGIYAVTDQIEVSLPIYMTKELKLSVNFIESAGVKMRNVTYSINPETITVSGDSAILKDIESITLGDLNLADLVDAGSTNHIYYPITAPSSCENLSGVSRASVQIAFNDMSIMQIVTSHFVLPTNLPEGETAEILTDNLQVTIFGLSAAVAAVSSENIVVTPDLDEYTAASGIYTVPAVVNVQTSGDVGVFGSYQVQVRIRKEST